MSPEETVERVKLHDKLLLGDPENIVEMPGVIAQHRRTNEILEEVRDSLARINWLLVSAFVVALIAVVFKNFTPPHP